MFLGPMSSDGNSQAILMSVPLLTQFHPVLYTISNPIIAYALPPSKQSLAGGVFNTMCQISNSVGLTVGAVIAASVTASQVTVGEAESGNEAALEKGFQAAFWTCAASISLVMVVSLLGLKKAGKFEQKSD